MDGPLGGGLLPSKKKHDDAEFDITAMIDLVFLMNIYFMFLFITAAAGADPSFSHTGPVLLVPRSSCFYAETALPLLPGPQAGRHSERRSRSPADDADQMA